MRQALKDIKHTEYWIFGLDTQDLSHTLELADRLIEAQCRDLDRRAQEAIEAYPDPEIHVEIISDLRHYAWVDAQYLWQFCLWRLQGILEGIIVHQLLPVSSGERLLGLKAKLGALVSEGYRISDDERAAILDWAALRNSLSHAPPEYHSPGPLRQEDVHEYKELVERLVVRWLQEKESGLPRV